jgi:hypothetical protein
VEWQLVAIPLGGQVHHERDAVAGIVKLNVVHVVDIKLLLVDKDRESVFFLV